MRYKAVYMADSFLMLLIGAGSENHYRVTTGIPLDAAVIEVLRLPQQIIALVYEHPSWPDVERSSGLYPWPTITLHFDTAPTVRLAPAPAPPADEPRCTLSTQKPWCRFAYERCTCAEVPPWWKEPS